MKAVNLENVKEAGEYAKVTEGGYVCRITKVTDTPDKEYLVVEYDFAEGPLKDYYKDLNDAKGFWGGKMFKSYKEKALPMFKRFCSAVTNSNKGFIFDGGKQNSNEQTLVGKYIGLVIGEEQYTGNDGTVKVRPYVFSETSVDKIHSGDFIVPAFKPLPGVASEEVRVASPDGFIAVPDGADDEGLPF